jgi:hypothetical protein
MIGQFNDAVMITSNAKMPQGLIPHSFRFRKVNMAQDRFAQRICWYIIAASTVIEQTQTQTTSKNQLQNGITVWMHQSRLQFLAVLARPAHLLWTVFSPLVLIL